MEETYVEEHRDDRYFNRLRLQARAFGEYEGGMERGGRDRASFSPDYINAIWEGRD